jgi:3-phenylpropionate/trans-cinnamate dioxygenase ferredoxin reductase component
MPDQTYVVVGANLTGGRAVEALRKEGFDGRIVLIGTEPDPPYERPPLSKEYLRGDMPREKIFIKPREWYDEQSIELRLSTTATRIDVSAQTVHVDEAEPVPYDKVLIATGGRERRISVPGNDLEGIYYLRRVGDSDRIGAELQAGRRAVVIGAGFIGAEVAATARKKELEVTVLEMADVPLERALGREIGELYAGFHREQGVDLRTGEDLDRFEGDGRVERAVGKSGTTFDCDFVVVGVGIEPNVELAQDAGLTVDNGILVDEYCQTSDPNIYAAGDVANYYHPVLDQRLRIEHWANAQNQGAAAAKNMLGKREPYVELPWFWSDQYDLNMQLVGYASTWDEVVVRGDVSSRSFSAFYLKGSRLLATLAVNRFKDIRPSRELIKQRVPLDAAQLRDESVELKSMVPQPS